MAGRKQETQLRTAGGIQYELTRKRVKNLNIRVREDGTVAVSIPLRTSAEAADRFVAARADWVQQARERAMRPVLGQLRMIEAAIGCDLACRAAVSAWRRAAA